jgi:hypothetical protein
MYKDEPQYAVKREQYIQSNQPCAVPSPSTTAEMCLKSLRASADGLDNLTRRLSEKLSPICSQHESPCKTASGTEREYPSYFTELRAVNWQLERIAETIESMLDRCEL